MIIIIILLVFPFQHPLQIHLYTSNRSVFFLCLGVHHHTGYLNFLVSTVFILVHTKRHPQPTYRLHTHTYTPVLSQTSWYAHLKLSALSQTCHIHTLQIFILLRQNFRLNRGSNLRTVCLCVLAVHLEVATCFQQVYSCKVKRDNYFSRRNKMRHKRNWKQ